MLRRRAGTCAAGAVGSGGVPGSRRTRPAACQPPARRGVPRQPRVAPGFLPAEARGAPRKLTGASQPRPGALPTPAGVRGELCGGLPARPGPRVVWSICFRLLLTYSRARSRGGVR